MRGRKKQQQIIEGLVAPEELVSEELYLFSTHHSPIQKTCTFYKKKTKKTTNGKPKVKRASTSYFYYYY